MVPPVGTTGATGAFEDQALVLTPAMFGYTDPNDNPANAFDAVFITGLPEAGKGTLNFNGTPATPNTRVTVAQPGGGETEFPSQVPQQ